VADGWPTPQMPGPDRIFGTAFRKHFRNAFRAPALLGQPRESPHPRNLRRPKVPTHLGAFHLAVGLLERLCGGRLLRSAPASARSAPRAPAFGLSNERGLHASPPARSASRDHIRDQCVEAFTKNFFAGFPKTEEEKMRRREEMARRP
jgi:hypothetical protein